MGCSVLLKNKKIMIAIITAIILAIGFIIIIFVGRDSQKTNKPASHISNDEAQDDVDKDITDDSNNESTDEPYSGDGLEIVEEGDKTPEDSVDSSGSWDNATSEEDVDNNDGKTDNNEKTEDDVPEEDVLKDDKVWGTIF